MLVVYIYYRNKIDKPIGFLKLTVMRKRFFLAEGQEGTFCIVVINNRKSHGFQGGRGERASTREKMGTGSIEEVGGEERGQ